MKSKSILSSLDLLLNDHGEKYKTKISFFVKYDKGEFYDLCMRSIENRDYFEVFCGDMRPITDHTNTGYKDIKGYERHPINQWDKFMDKLLADGWQCRDEYIEDFSRYKINKTGKDMFEQIRSNFSKITRLQQEMTADAKHLIPRLRLVGEILGSIPIDYNPTIEELDTDINKRNDYVIRNQSTIAAVAQYDLYSIKALDECETLLNKMMEIDLNEELETLIKKICSLIKKIHMILGVGSGRWLLSETKKAKSKNDIQKVINETEDRVNARIDITRAYTDSIKQFLPLENIPALSDLEDLDSLSFDFDGDKYIIENADENLLQEIQKCMGVSKGRLVNAYKIINTDTQNAYDTAMAGIKKAANRKEKLLWHGSITANWPNIIKSGMLMSKARNGMFGRGIYFADDLMKSRGYTSVKDSKWAGGKDPTGFVALFRVRIGNFVKLTYGDRNAKRFVDSGHYDSVKGCKGSALRKNEYIVYNDNQSTIYALVEVR